jgi:hypothetical protein
MRNLTLFLFLALSFSANCQPWLYETNPLVTPVSETSRPVLGLFKTEKQASAWLGIGGLTSMFAGSYLQGRASYYIQVHGHSDDFDTYAVTRFSGAVLQLGGAGAYGTGFAYRSKRWYKKNAWLWGIGEAALLFGANCVVSQWSYHQMYR